jgi:NADH:ubiquinone oxidoreductase subunit E
MKAFAAREEVDAEDLRFLAQHLGLRDAHEAIDLVERFYAPHRLKPVTRYLLEDLFVDLASPGDDPV